MRTPSRQRARGFSLIEILVTFLIVTVALLGAAGLQLRALRTGQGNQFRTQAIELASDLAERMEANKTQAKSVNSGYLVAPTNTAVTLVDSCYPNGCAQASDLAQSDIAIWENAITHSIPPLPNPSWSVTSTTAANGNVIYTITINWTDRRTDSSYSTTGTGETFSYTAQKTLY